MGRRTADRARVATVIARMSGLFAAALLGGCSTTGGDQLTLFADPGKYQYSSCEHLAGQRKYWTGREQELRMLIDRAEQSAGGAVVGVLAYKAEQVTASEEIKMVELAARAKNCEGPATWSSSSAVR
jgi:hypothetical protein